MRVIDHNHDEGTLEEIIAEIRKLADKHEILGVTVNYKILPKSKIKLVSHNVDMLV